MVFSGINLTIIEVLSGTHPKLSVEWNPPFMVSYERHKRTRQGGVGHDLKICNLGGDATLEYEKWVSGDSQGLYTLTIDSGECMNFYFCIPLSHMERELERIKNGYVTIRLRAKATNSAGTDIYDQTRKVLITGLASIKVIVKDNLGQKIEDARIYLGESYEGETNSNGEYTISHLFSKNYKIEVSKSGYYGDYEYVYPKAGDTETVYLTLERIPPTTTTPSPTTSAPTTTPAPITSPPTTPPSPITTSPPTTKSPTTSPPTTTPVPTTTPAPSQQSNTSLYLGIVAVTVLILGLAVYQITKKKPEKEVTEKPIEKKPPEKSSLEKISPRLQKLNNEKQELRDQLEELKKQKEDLIKKGVMTEEMYKQRYEEIMDQLVDLEDKIIQEKMKRGKKK